MFYKLINGIKINDNEKKYIKKIIHKFSKISLVVIKFNSKEDKNNIINHNKCMGLSKPCTNCIKVMKLFNMRDVYYSDIDGEIVCEKIKNISSSHKSQMFKHIINSNFY